MTRLFPALKPIITGSGLAMLLLARASAAQAPPPARTHPVSPATTVAPASSEAICQCEGQGNPQPSKERCARAHYDRGDERFIKNDYDGAHGEFVKALACDRKPQTMAMIASSLKGLQRYEEALDKSEQILREFSNLPKKLKEDLRVDIGHLKQLVGTLILRGDTPDGARLFIDNRDRGTLPLAAPLRVAVGTRKLRLEKEGFKPITGTVDVQADKKNEASLLAESRVGKLTVEDKHGWGLQVELDGKSVGTTPLNNFEVPPGKHTVRLNGSLGLDKLAAVCAVSEPASVRKTTLPGQEAKMGSSTTTVTVKLYDITKVTLSAEELDAPLRIESTPKGARLKIDSKEMGNTPWEGRLLLGQHAIEVASPGFVTSTQQVQIEPRNRKDVRVVLQRKPTGAGLQRARNIGAGVAYSVGGLALVLFAVTGGMALQTRSEIKDACPNNLCPGSKGGLLSKAHALSTASTVGFSLGLIGVTAGTIVWFQLRPDAPGAEQSGQTTGGMAWAAGVRRDGFAIEGSF